MVVPQMDGLIWKIVLKWMIWGYPHFRKPPYVYGKAIGELMITHENLGQVP